MSAKFWSTLEQFLKQHNSEWYCELPYEAQDELVGIVAEVLPNALEWHTDNCSTPLMPGLLASLYAGSNIGWEKGHNDSPAPAKFLLENITLHTDVDSFMKVLYQRPPCGAITFGWDSYYGGGEDCFWRPGNKKERIVSWFRNTFWDPDNNRCCAGVGGVIGFIRGDKLELYCFTQNYVEIVESTHRQLDQMTAKEKASKELPFILQQYTELLGRHAVEQALQAIPQ